MTARFELVRGLAGLVTLAGLAAGNVPATIGGLLLIVALTLLMPRIRER